ncbi:Wzz/FepE/Etk N-terminal domain-containing protein [uncultured Draconibacterium sp.]|uniref:Wzz/FepE/Etk N-terminal domain-containing protein n=1 Tax=uncultured Draconibacterium sp. TaxID=1573823 RepID=UPI0032162E1C
MTNEINNNQVSEDEIDLIALAKTIWKGRKLIIITVLIFMAIGVAVALLSPKEYSSSTTMVPQLSNNSSKMGGLSSLAAMAGFNLGDLNKSSGELSPYIYPQIVQSVPFQLELMNASYTFSAVDHPVSFYEYYTQHYTPGFLASLKKYTIGLPFVILSAIKGEDQTSGKTLETNDYIYLTKEQEEVRKILANGVTLETNDKDGYVTLSVRSNEAKLSAQIAQKAQMLLQKYITTFKIEKASAQLKFIEERYADNKKEFEAAQAALADFRDKNKNVTSARARTQEERLQSDYQLAFDVYSQLAQQLEQARIQVKEDTPVFSIIKPVTVPLEDNGSGLMTLLIWTFLGGVIAIGWIFGKEFLTSIKEKWNSEEAR